ncbi:hypothetical protein LCGC14_2834580 [marine sediment metagenome]|uniref:Uncharacterized protein n=1 Tax=marine sediment metagenome TaxID=412755 RepID=A0A0F9ALF5_9ZZZZ
MNSNGSNTGPPWPFTLFMGLVAVELVVGFILGFLYITGNLY